MNEAPEAVVAVWTVTLLIIALVIVPVALILLARTTQAALRVEHYLREMAQAGGGIAGNLKAAALLDETVAAAARLTGATPPATAWRPES